MSALARICDAGEAASAGQHAGTVWSAAATIDVLAVAAGGRQRGAVTPGLIEFGTDTLVDRPESAVSHQFHLLLQATFGGVLSPDRAGDLQAVSNIDAVNTAKLFEA